MVQHEILAIGLVGAAWLVTLKTAHQTGYRKGLTKGLMDNPPMDNLCGCGHARSFHTNLSGGCYEVTVRAKYEEDNHTCACRQYAQAPLDTTGMFSNGGV